MITPAENDGVRDLKKKKNRPITTMLSYFGRQRHRNHQRREHEHAHGAAEQQQRLAPETVDKRGREYGHREVYRPGAQVPVLGHGRAHARVFEYRRRVIEHL